MLRELNLFMTSKVLEIKDIKILRKEIRKKRRSLDRFTLRQSEQAAANRLLRLPQIRNSRNIGVYLDAFGEVPTAKLIITLLKRQKNVYLPLICNMDKTLHWQRISLQQWRNQRFFLHRLGMRQAMHSRGRLTSHLHCLILPLVVFDTQGHRVGMGGGFYDRTLAKCPTSPTRIGYAYDFQKSPHLLEVQKWDQGLDLMCTPNMMMRFNR